MTVEDGVQVAPPGQQARDGRPFTALSSVPLSAGVQAAPGGRGSGPLPEARGGDSRVRRAPEPPAWSRGPSHLSRYEGGPGTQGCRGGAGGSTLQALSGKPRGAGTAVGGQRAGTWAPSSAFSAGVGAGGWGGGGQASDDGGWRDWGGGGGDWSGA